VSEKYQAVEQLKAGRWNDLGQGAAIRRAVERFDRVIAQPMAGGLHHRYARIQFW
jgi:hypothetical protein